MPVVDCAAVVELTLDVTTPVPLVELVAAAVGDEFVELEVFEEEVCADVVPLVDVVVGVVASAFITSALI
jgi:hypothetical protein